MDRFVKLGVVRDVEDRLLNDKKGNYVHLLIVDDYGTSMFVYPCLYMFVYPPYLMVGWGFAYINMVVGFW